MLRKLRNLVAPLAGALVVVGCLLGTSNAASVTDDTNAVTPADQAVSARDDSGSVPIQLAADRDRDGRDRGRRHGRDRDHWRGDRRDHWRGGFWYGYPSGYYYPRYYYRDYGYTTCYWDPYYREWVCYSS